MLLSFLSLDRLYIIIINKREARKEGKEPARGRNFLSIRSTSQNSFRRDIYIY